MVDGIPDYLKGSGCIIDSSISFGTGLTIGNFCIIEKNVELGNNVKISDYVKIPEGSKIGNDVVIGSYVRLGKRCEIQDRVTIKCHAVISPDVVVCEGAFIGPNVILLHQTPDGKHKPCKVGQDAFIGTGVYVNPGVEVFPEIVIGAGSVVTKTLKEKGVYLGSPARLTRIPRSKHE